MRYLWFLHRLSGYPSKLLSRPINPVGMRTDGSGPGLQDPGRAVLPAKLAADCERLHGRLQGVAA